MQCGFVSHTFYTQVGSALEHITGYYWTQTANEDNTTRIVIIADVRDNSFVAFRICGGCSILPYSAITNNCTNKVRRKDNLLEFEYGKYHKQEISKKLKIALKELYQNNGFKKLERFKLPMLENFINMMEL